MGNEGGREEELFQIEESDGSGNKDEASYLRPQKKKGKEDSARRRYLS